VYVESKLLKDEVMSQTVLFIDSSPLGERSVSRQLTAKVLGALRAKSGNIKGVRRDIGANPLPHLSGAVIEAFLTPAGQGGPTVADAINLSDQAVDELLGADVIVIGAPMYNLGILSSLKAWIDHVVRVGRTFRYGATGRPESLIPPGKKVIVASSRGGIYTDGPQKPFDFQETYLRAVFGFLGLTDISFIRAEGVSMGPGAARNAMQSAENQLMETLGSQAKRHAPSLQTDCRADGRI
jgi:FMN-dependent NADH-azoreductase